MRYSQKHKEKTRAKIVNAAARTFRTKGYEGVGIDTLVEAASATSGAFYGHFSSKREAFRETVSGAMDRLATGLRKFQDENPDRWIEDLASYYMGEGHRDNVAGGCGLPSLSGDIARSDAKTKSEFEMGLMKAHELLANSPQLSKFSDSDQRAWVMLALMLGGVTLARAVRKPTTAKRIAGSVKRQIERQRV